MGSRSQKYLFRSKNSLWISILIICAFSYFTNAQTINYVSNGSFESLNSFSATSKYNVVNYWQPIDTNKPADYLVTLIPEIANGPYALGFQYPKSGKNYIVSQFFNYRGYPRNRLKIKLKSNVTYCAKYHIVNTNSNPYAVDGFGMYFANETLDTIKYCNVALSYLSPQIENPAGNIITDTLNWIAITGTFVADGSEKYLVLGNFKSDAATNTILINPTYSTTITSDICIDDVSCFEVNAPAYAGPDKFILAGDSAFVGSEPDFAIDKHCVWYSLPGMTLIDTVAGLWVKPLVTTTYVIRQELECNSVKWDTVTVYVDYVGIDELNDNTGFELFPCPADKQIAIKLREGVTNGGAFRLRFFDGLGMLVREEDLILRSQAASVDVGDFLPGIYYIELVSGDEVAGRKRLLIAH